MKNLNETLSLLQKSSTKDAMEQRKIIASAVFDHRYGYPSINETKYVKQESKSLKTKLLSGDTTDLKPKHRKSLDFFAVSVKEIADKCWRTNCSVVKPGKHSRPKAALKDGVEFVPAIYQTLTDKEAYEAFKDMYEEEV